ncbi:glycosyltransferase family 2 protein [Caldifermentibacillus hisashii]|uniref:glycosyltransferase family 2 protein n=1 Tax=Caldifermentibacillus hisashii TaxID=996558 RepID=UPI0034D61FAC
MNQIKKQAHLPLIKKRDKGKTQLDFTIHQKSKKRDYLVTVITPVYNGEAFLKKSIESVLNQSLSFHKIEYILIDDCSTDRSRNLLLDYGKRYDNISVVSLECNSGSPSHPRNIGIKLASAPYITFLDADDWFHPNGLQVLYEILEETGDPYVVGRTMKVESGKIQVIGEHQCCKERRSVSPFSIPHIFHHLGPTARMIRTSFIREHQISFPEMKFAEDKLFFIDVLTNCKRISTTTKPIYYVNRLDETKKTRLTNQTNILQKTNYNLQVVHYTLSRKFNTEIEKMIINRIYEFDFMRRFFTTPHFQRTRWKLLYYYKFRQMLKPAKKLSYNLSETFMQPIHIVIYDLIQKGKYRSVTKLLEWEQSVKVKEVTIRNGKPYFVTPLLEEKYKYIPVPFYVAFKKHFCQGGKYILYFHVYGDNVQAITDVLIREGKNAHNEVVLPVSVDKNGEGWVELHLDAFKNLSAGHYSIFVRYNDYMKMNIRQHEKNEIKHQLDNREFNFYQSSFSNVALRVK